MRIFIVGMPGAGNLGDDLISVLLVNCIMKTYPDAEIGILLEETSNIISYDYHDKIHLFLRPRFNKITSYINRNAKLNKFLKKTDVILIGGGGLIQDTHFRYNIHEYIKYGFRVSAKNAILVTLGIGVGPIKYSLNRYYLRYFLNKFSHIEVRDEESAKELSLLSKQNIYTSNDVVEGSPRNKLSFYKEQKGTKNILGCSIRPWKSLDMDSVVHIITQVSLKEKLDVYLFVFEHLGQNNEELKYAQEIKNRLNINNINTSICCYGEDKLDAFIEAFCSVKKAIAIRYHANILWQKLGVPVMPISYAPKVDSYYKKHGIKTYSIEEISSFKITSDINMLFTKINEENVKEFILPDINKLLQKGNNHNFYFIYVLVSNIFSLLSMVHLLTFYIKRKLKI